MESFIKDTVNAMAAQMNLKTPEVSRSKCLAQKIVIVDGQGGCGKTMLAPIVSALDRVELLSYSYETEHICGLWKLKRLDDDVAVAMIRMITDLKLYNTLMGRDTNFRVPDLSSVFNDAKPWRYFKRIISRGDAAVPDRIPKERPILLLTTHTLLNIGEPVFKALGDRLVFIDMVRHPLHMIKQIVLLEMDQVFSSARNFGLHIKYKGHEIPYYTHGWEELFVRSNKFERAIYFIDHTFRANLKARQLMIDRYNANIITVPFEHFVLEPMPYLERIAQALDSKITSTTRRMMKKQNVPRKLSSEGRSLKIYMRNGWEPPQKGSNERKELERCRNFVVNEVSAEALATLDQFSADYEKQYAIHFQNIKE
ncbi:MAG: hypothetical protein A2Z88_07735 [Omnitrophica WOR_2 bacterium GWA2_47_8]|nr:MAG: hypothetical protein A2Z88_07735 [Omnitrophica WOR_2 bacterium GWA2_47_8]